MKEDPKNGRGREVFIDIAGHRIKLGELMVRPFIDSLVSQGYRVTIIDGEVKYSKMPNKERN